MTIVTITIVMGFQTSQWRSDGGDAGVGGGDDDGANGDGDGRWWLVLL